MEPPHQNFLGGTEECHSSESGWTMYIGSPIDEDDESNIEDCYDDEGTQVEDAEVIESDDSMASDASSGPSHYNSLNHLKQKVEEEYDDDEVEYCSDQKKGNQKVGKKGEEKKIFMDNKGKDSIQGGGKVKVRKNQWVGTRK